MMKKLLLSMLSLITVTAIHAQESCGVGTESPTSRFEIKGNGTTSSTSALNVTNSSGTSMLYVRDDGKVSIGTESPAAVLDVRGDAIFNEDGDDKDFRIEGDTEGNLFLIDASADNVAIGASSADARLEVSAADGNNNVAGVFENDNDNTTITTGAGSLYLVNRDLTNNNFVKLGFMDDPTGQAASIIATKISDHTNNYGDFQFWTRGSSGYGVRMLIEEDGDVGIGTTSPDEELHVVGNIKMVDGNESDGKVLTSDANGVATWEDAAPSSYTVLSKSANYAMGNDDHVILCDATTASFDVTLPSPSTNSGKYYIIKKVEPSSTSKIISVKPNGSEKIDNASQKNIATRYNSLTFLSDGTDWHIISGYKE